MCPRLRKNMNQYVSVHTMAMSRMTFTVPEELKRRLQARRDVNWSAFVARELQRRLDVLEELDRLTAGSQATEEDVEELSAMIKKAVGSRFREDMARLKAEREGSSSTRTD